MITVRSSNSLGAVEVHVDASSKVLREVELGAIVCSNGWDDVTAALQLLSHFDVALLIPESQRVVPFYCWIITALQGDWQNTSVSFSGRLSVRRAIRQFCH